MTSGERTLTVCIHGRVYSSLSEVNEPCLDCAELEALRDLEQMVRKHECCEALLGIHAPWRTEACQAHLKVIDAIRTRKGPGAIGACTCPGRQGNPGRLAVDSSCPQHGCRTP